MSDEAIDKTNTPRSELSRFTAWATPRALKAKQAQVLLDARGVAHAVKRRGHWPQPK